MIWRSLLLSLLLLGLWSGTAWASPLAERVAQFPNWRTKPSVAVAQGDLTYPDWFAGTWNVSTALVDLAAPLAPDLVTPGFESNRKYLNQPVPFQARFVNQRRMPQPGVLPLPTRQPPALVADRAFNGLNIARAYLDQPNADKSTVLAVKVDPTNPNRQITVLRGDRQLVSTITGRAVETPDEDHFITTELFQQEFRSPSQLFFNEVETTTTYECKPGETIVADQITAIYLSPQDPDYFKAVNRPVALYRYRLEFTPMHEQNS